MKDHWSLRFQFCLWNPVWEFMEGIMVKCLQSDCLNLKIDGWKEDFCKWRLPLSLTESNLAFKILTALPLKIVLTGSKLLR